MNSNRDPGVCVRTSHLGQDVGYGLFARRNFDTNDVVAVYRGTLFYGPVPEHVDTTFVYEFESPQYGTVYVDPQGHDCPAQFANDAEGPVRVDGLENNTVFDDAHPRSVVLRATRPIRNGEEIFVSYGSDYWGVV